jgi:hypothetical protein
MDTFPVLNGLVGGNARPLPLFVLTLKLLLGRPKTSKGGYSWLEYTNFWIVLIMLISWTQGRCKAVAVQVTARGYIGRGRGDGRKGLLQFVFCICILSVIACVLNINCCGNTLNPSLLSHSCTYALGVLIVFWADVSFIFIFEAVIFLEFKHVTVYNGFACGSHEVYYCCLHGDKIIFRNTAIWFSWSLKVSVITTLL